MRLSLAGIFAISVWFCATAAADDSGPRARFDAGDFAGAVAGYEKIPPDRRGAEDWYYLGHALRESGQYARALAAYEGALGAGFPRVQVLASRALTQARMQDAGKTLATLTEAVEAGLGDGFLSTRPELAFVRGDTRFQALLADAARRSHPCLHEDRYRALDFWLGDWDVFSGPTLAGHNRISKIMDGCIVLEQWESASGSSGQSMNYYDPLAQAWRQAWVDTGGGVVHYRGQVRDGAMHFEGEQIEADGSRQLTRVVLAPQPDGSIRHRIENSADGGKSWEPYFDGTYRRAPDTATEKAK